MVTNEAEKGRPIASLANHLVAGRLEKACNALAEEDVVVCEDDPRRHE
jgi:hypothetical protein